jgi:hypothetical protein
MPASARRTVAIITGWHFFIRGQLAA